jgi:hypothetical protein
MRTPWLVRPLNVYEEIARIDALGGHKQVGGAAITPGRERFGGIGVGREPAPARGALGHTDKTGRLDPTLVWKRYGHLYPGSTREAAAALDRHLKAVAW